MRSRNRKVKKQGARLGSVGNYAERVSCGRCVGYGSCAGLLLLAFLLMNPVAGNEAQALEEGDYDDQIVATADSGVTISFTPSSGSASLTPTTSDGASAKINVSANVKIASTGGYTIYLGGKNAALTGEKTGEVISAMSGSKTFANLDTNTWGYVVAEGSSVSDGATYSALPQGQGVSLESRNGNQTNIDKTYAISFATKIGNNKPADVYSNQVTLSVTSTPWQITQLSNINEMQSMTTKICEGSAIGDTKQLKDTRDGKYYWVSKLADGKCWMTQNLDLDLSTSIALTPTTSDVSSNWTPEYSTVMSVTSSTLLADNVGQRSWSLGDYYIKTPNGTTSCGTGRSSLANCTAYFTALTTPTSANGDVNAHYAAGSYYQWNTATAGTGGTITGGEAVSSICPKGWRLPTSSSTGEFQALIAKYSATTTNTLVSAPLYFVRGGMVWRDSYLFSHAGNNGYYWSSSPDANGADAYTFFFSDTSNISPSTSNHRYFGFSVRCIAR